MEGGAGALPAPGSVPEAHRSGGPAPGSESWAQWGSRGTDFESHLAVAQKTGTQNGTLVSGNMDQNLRNPSCLILSHTHFLFQLGDSSFLDVDRMMPFLFLMHP